MTGSGMTTFCFVEKYSIDSMPLFCLHRYTFPPNTLVDGKLEQCRFQSGNKICQCNSDFENPR